MADSLPIPYKARYSLSEYWPMLLRGSLWKRYAENNEKESQALQLHVERKINQEADTIPVNLTHTFTGNAILMTIISLPAN